MDLDRGLLCGHSPVARRELTALWVDHVPSPLGTLTLVGAHGALRALAFPVERARMLRRLRSRYPGVVFEQRRAPDSYAARLRAYFRGDLQALDDIPVDCGGTAFEQQVWSALRTIPPGTTLTYRKLAELVRRPRAIRAVGRANALNPVCLVVPCHRSWGAMATSRDTPVVSGASDGCWLTREFRQLIQQSKTGAPV
jgi:methylated-DNA-[protein]-cysteine S-methyltransferase